MRKTGRLYNYVLTLLFLNRKLSTLSSCLLAVETIVRGLSALSSTQSWRMTRLISAVKKSKMQAHIQPYHPCPLPHLGMRNIICQASIRKLRFGVHILDTHSGIYVELQLRQPIQSEVPGNSISPCWRICPPFRYLDVPSYGPDTKSSKRRS
jgi:hypothetical protein